VSEENPRTVIVDGIETHLLIDGHLQSSVLRALTGTTPLDTEVDNLPSPMKPYWLIACVWLLKLYQAKISPRLGQRCVYEPSCSRYADLSLRKHGFFKGFYLTVKRLHRCRPGAGGVDLP
jgi:putative membrane protein insertion efficiency factor